MRPERITEQSPLHTDDSADQRTEGSHQRMVGCDVCRTTHPADDITHLRIYVAGSEGVNVCLQCRQTLTEVLRGMMRAEHAGMKRGYLACKEVQKAKASNDPSSATATTAGAERKGNDE